MQIFIYFWIFLMRSFKRTRNSQTKFNSCHMLLCQPPTRTRNHHLLVTKSVKGTHERRRPKTHGRTQCPKKDKKTLEQVGTWGSSRLFHFSNAPSVECGPSKLSVDKRAAQISICKFRFEHFKFRHVYVFVVCLIAWPNHFTFAI